MSTDGEHETEVDTAAPTGSALSRMYRGESVIDFPRLWKSTLVLSAGVVLISIGAIVFRGLNLGIDFEGGTSWEVQSGELSTDDVTDAVADLVGPSARVQSVGGDIIRVRADVDGPDAVQTVRARLADAASVEVNEVSVSDVGPTWGDEITRKAIQALIVFFIAIALYISIRLEWKMAIGALVAVAHDIVVSVGIYALFQFEVTQATVIAFLTIMGYSLYDTIVVYDKVREITGRVGATGRYTYTEMMNLSLNQVIMRSINTTITSVLPVLSMLLIGSFLLGATTLREFSIALLIGLIVGGYSSIFVASQLVAWLKEREPAYADIATKIERRGGGGTRLVSAEDAVVGAAPKRIRDRPSTSGSGKSSTSASGKSSTSGSGKSSTSASRKSSTSEAGARAGAKDNAKDNTTDRSGPRVPAAGGSTIPPRPRKKKRKK
ncbi:MAG: protein translocase subunit SecF [Acidimicrobiales bacterium]|nr:protein translocase subunit SecF [Acidimicrobiales bacterium]